MGCAALNGAVCIAGEQLLEHWNWGVAQHLRLVADGGDLIVCMQAFWQNFLQHSGGTLTDSRSPNYCVEVLTVGLLLTVRFGGSCAKRKRGKGK